MWVTTNGIPSTLLPRKGVQREIYTRHTRLGQCTHIGSWRGGLISKLLSFDPEFAFNIQTLNTAEIDAKIQAAESSISIATNEDNETRGAFDHTNNRKNNRF